MAGLPPSSRALYFQLGDEGRDAPLTKLVSRLGAGERVRICGRVENPMPFLVAADAYVMPSDVEGFGVAAAEAMAVGVPSILADRPALRDFRRATDAIEFVECSAESVRKGILRLENLPPGERWRIGGRLAAAMPRYCGLAVGPRMFADLYRGIPPAPWP